MALELKNAIQMGHLINLAAFVRTIDENDKEVHLIGTIVGKARGVSYRANPNGNEPSIGITGIFEAVPVEEGRPVMRGPMVYLPSAFAKMLEAELVGDQKRPDKAPPKGKSIELAGVAEIPLAVEIGIRRNNGAGVGYEFSVVTHGEKVEAVDALNDLRALLPKTTQRVAALPAPDPQSAPASNSAKPKPKDKRR